MNKTQLIAGAGGGGGSGGKGSTQGAVISPDTLQSTEVLAMLDLLGEGQIGGLINGAQSIFFNGTPLQNADGTYNFAGVGWQALPGTQDQGPMPGFYDAESTVAVEIKVTYEIPYTITISDPNVDSVRIITNIPALSVQDTKTGNVSGTTVVYEFSISTDGGAFVVAGGTQTVGGKTGSKWQQSYALALPKPGTSWQIKMTRLSQDSIAPADQTSPAYQTWLAANPPGSVFNNDTYFDSYVTVKNSLLSYPNSALIGVALDASQFNQIPKRTYLVAGIMIQVPSNYDPVAHTYTGVWDGTFKVAVSSNPAWILYDLMTSKRYGLGNYITSSQIDKSGLYVIGQYCDGLVPDGFGGQEPRFEINTQIATQSDAYTLVSNITSAFRGMGYWSGGMMGFTQDSPTAPTMIYSQANVIGGEFTYTGTSRRDRHSVVLVSWNDPNNKYLQAIEYVEDSNLIAKWGVRKMDTVAFGCTSRGQANRAGRWILYTEQYETDFITFSVGMDSAMVLPGEVIKIHDTMRSGKRMAGRLTACTANVATLDAPVALGSTGAILSLRLADGTFIDCPVNEGIGTWATLSWATALTTLPVANAMFIVAESDLNPVLARILSIAENKGGGTYMITAASHNPSKYGVIENGFALNTVNTSILTGIPSAPTGLVVTDAIYQSGSSIATKMLVSWDSGPVSLRGWRLRVSKSSENWVEYNNLATAQFDVPNVHDGVAYSIQVYAISLTGLQSTACASTTYTILGKNRPPSNVTGVTAGLNSQGVILNWTQIPDIDLACYEVRVDPWASNPSLGQVAGDFMNMGPLVAGTHTWDVCALDTTGHYSTAPSPVSFTVNAPSAATSFAGVISGANVVLKWAAPASSQAITRYQLAEAGLGIATVSALTYTVRANWLGSQSFAIAAYDAAGNLGPDATCAVVINAPIAPVINAPAFTAQSIKLTWQDCTTSLPIASYEIRQGSTYAVAVVIGVVTAQTFSMIGDWVGSESFWVTGKDIAGNAGTPTEVTITISIPGNPVLSAMVSGAYAVMSWTVPPSSLPISGYEVRAGSTWALAQVTPPVIVSGTTHNVKINWSGSQNLWVAAIDASGNYGSPVSYALVVSVPATPSVTGSISGTTATLSFSATPTDSAIASYEIRQGSGTWATATPVTVVQANTFSLPANWTGGETFQVAANDVAGNQGLPGSTVVTVSVATAPILTPSFLADQFVLGWSVPSATLPLVDYEVRYGSTWSGATSLGHIKGTSFTVSAQWAGSRTWWVAAYDADGNVGTPGSSSVTINVAAAPIMTQQVVDNNVLLYWTQVQGTLPTKTYEIRKGSTWAGGTLIGVKTGGFTTVFETVAGTYTYWSCAIDSAGNYGTPGSVAASVSQPPDYVLKANDNSTFSGTKSNMLLDDDGGYIMPVNITETVDQHFSRNAIIPSTNLTNAYWQSIASQCAVTATTVVTSPDGSNDAFVVTAAAAPTNTYFGHIETTLNLQGQQMTFECFLRLGTMTGPIELWLRDSAGANVAASDFTLSGAGTYTTTVGTAAITSLANGWYRCSITGTFSASAALGYQIIVDPTNAPVAGETYYAFGPQLLYGALGNYWFSPQDQVNAGFPIVIEPSITAALYEEVIDYGTVLAATKITVTPTYAIISGTPASSCTISTSPDNTTWTVYANQWSVYGTNFRYVKIHIDVSAAGSGTDLYKLYGLNIRLDAKLRNDGGMGNAGATDAVSGTTAIINGVSTANANMPNSFGNSVPDGPGTLVIFNLAFIDVTSVSVSIASGTTAAYALYAFDGVANPSGMTVILYNSAGAQVSGAFSWALKGY